MTTTDHSPGRRRETASPLGLWGLFGLQLFCAIFFVGDAVLDLLGFESKFGFREYDIFEYLIAAALFLGVLATWFQIRRVLSRNARLSDQIRAASGEFTALLDEYFATWSLTPAERDVAMLTIKGMSVAEIANARGSAEGTVKAHSAAVYRKAGVNGRMQLLSLFLDELVADMR